MKIEICKYYNDHQTACSIMIDDLVPAAITNNGFANAGNDWGFLLDEPGSLYHYFDKYLLQKFPEIKGTFFLPLSSQNYIPLDKGYVVIKKDVDSIQFLSFLHRISSRFEMAFHGDKHEFLNEKGESVHEFAHITPDQVNVVTNTVKGFILKTGIQFTGGKFPGYNYNQAALKIISELGVKWWALNVKMINKIHVNNKLIYDDKLNIVLVPTNVTGDIFKNFYLTSQNKLKRLMKYLLKLKKQSDPLSFLKYLYKNQFPIIIQEHFQNQKTNGMRQTPNIYDDIWSLDLIFTFLKGKDVWYATCGEIAHYYDSYVNSSISAISGSRFTVKYHGIWENMFLSIQLDKATLVHQETGQKLHGICKNNKWIFNNIPQGSFEVI